MDEAYRSAHTGNSGDATDVFDGIRFTAFTPQTNPSSRGVWIKDIRRSGTDLIADIRFSKWSGMITEDITWDGLINVVGDIMVQEGANLTICPGTVVRFSSTDALRSGADPDRCEIDIFGTLKIKMVGHADPIRFTAEGKGTWVGIRLHDPTASMQWYKDPEIRVEDCDHPHGIFWSEHPDAKGPELQCMVQDHGAGGNGDGTLNPGKTVQLALDIRNWTTVPFRVVVSVSDPFVTPNGATLSSVTVIPGRTERSTGSFTVDANCPDGYGISFNVAFAEYKSSTTWTETFSLPVNSLKREHSTELVTEVGETNPLHILPCSFALRQNAPNPFNPQTTLTYRLPEASEVRLTIYTPSGQWVKTLVQARQEAGVYRVDWDGTNETGRPAAAGVYLYRLKAGDFLKVRKMVLLR